MTAHSSSPSPHPLADPAHRSYLLRKLHSLTGVVPVGGFMVFHLWTNAKAITGQAAFDAAVADINHTPYLPLLELGILLPLAFHAGYGIKLAFQGRPNVGAYPYTRSWMYLMQRVTGIVALVFILYHLYELRLQKLIGATAINAFYPTLCADLSSTVGGVPWVALLYVIGIAACVFHFANGLWGFAFSWGITVSRRSQQLAATAFGALGVVIFLLGANTTLFFATGSRFFVPASSGHDSPRSCVDVKQPPSAIVAR